jgi:hypothetical protein
MPNGIFLRDLPSNAFLDLELVAFDAATVAVDDAAMVLLADDLL